MLSALAADRTRVADIDTRILVLVRSLAALRNEKALAQERLDSYKYPVLTLPNEIISEIFMQFLPPYPLCPPSTGLSSPTLLTQICRRWREIALASPMLWRAITITLSLYDIPFHRQRHLLDFLRRSSCCPLSIQSDLDSNDAAVRVTEVFVAVAAHRARWEHVRLRLTSQQLSLSTIVGPMPLLRDLQLALIDDPHPPSIFPLHEVPLLRSVILEEYAPSNVSLPWAQLTSLTLNTVYRSEYLPILQQAHNLVQCRLDILFDDNDPPDPHEITLPCLQSLTLGDANSNWAGTYPDFFVVPALRSLQIPRSLLGPDPIAALTAFVSKSACKPQEVRITGASSTTSGLYLKAFPSIPQLSFVDPYSDDEEDSQGASDSDSSDGGTS